MLDDNRSLQLPIVMLEGCRLLVISGYRVDVGGLRDPRPSNVEKARWRRLVGSGRNRPNICCVNSHPVSVFSAYSSCYTYQTPWELNYCERADCLLSEYAILTTIDIQTSHD